MRVMRIAVPMRVVVMIPFGAALVVAGLLGWRLGGPTEARTQPGAVRSAGHLLRRVPRDPVPASEFERDCDQLQKQLDDIQARTARAESSMPPVRARQDDPAARRRAIEEMQQKMTGERWHLQLPLYIVPAPVQ